MSGGRLRVLVGVAVLATPAASTLLLVWAHLGASLLDFVPGAVNDEILYWHQIRTFQKVGWSGGYYTAHESIAPAGFSHFYVHGPAFPVLYGGAARLFDWQLHSAPFYNLAVVTLGVAAFLWLVRPDTRGLVAFGLLLATSWPIPYFAPSNMQASVHHALALVFAGLFHVLIDRPRGRGGLAALTGLALLVALAAALRPTWLLLSVGLLGVLAVRTRASPLGLAGISAAVLGCAGLVGAAVIQLSAPLPGIDPALPTTPTNWRSGIDLSDFLWRIEQNFSLLSRDAIGISAHPAIQWTVTLVPLLLGSLLIAGERAWRRRGSDDEGGRRRLAESLCHAASLGGILGFLVVCYDLGDFRGVRMTSPHVLLSLALLAARRHTRLLAPFLLAQAVLLVPSLDLASRYRSASFEYDAGRIAQFRRSVAGSIAYDPAAPSPWCNTLLSSELPRWLLGTPAGIGISFVLSTDYEMELPPRSRYLVLHAGHLDWMERGIFYGSRPTELRLESLAGNEIGGLYRNLDAPCGSSVSGAGGP